MLFISLLFEILKYNINRDRNANNRDSEKLSRTNIHHTCTHSNKYTIQASPAINSMNIITTNSQSICWFFLITMNLSTAQHVIQKNAYIYIYNTCLFVRAHCDYANLRSMTLLGFTLISMFFVLLYIWEIPYLIQCIVNLFHS